MSKKLLPPSCYEISEFVNCVVLFVLFVFIYFMCLKLRVVFVFWTARENRLQSERFEVLTKFVLKSEVFWGITPCRLINIYQSTRLNNPECFSLCNADFIKTVGNDLNIVSTIGFCQYGNAPDYPSYYQFRKKTTIVCFEHLRHE